VSVEAAGRGLRRSSALDGESALRSASQGPSGSDPPGCDEAGMMSFEVCRRLKETGDGDIPVIFLTPFPKKRMKARDGTRRSGLHTKSLSPVPRKTRVRNHLETEKIPNHLEAPVARADA